MFETETKLPRKHHRVTGNTKSVTVADRNSGPRPLAYAALEISPLFEEFYSGIPVVTAQLARHCMLDPTIDWIFLYGSIIVPQDLVELLLVRRSGSSLLNELPRIACNEGLIDIKEAARRVCLWPNVKSMAGKFAREAFIIHDLSTLLTPQHHHPDAIAHHSDRILADCRTSERVFCVSDATRRDAMAYLNLPEEQTSILPLGVDYDEGSLYEEVLYQRQNISERYIVVLGTIEPRKNGAIVIEMLARNPDIAKDYRIVIVGRDGWLGERERLLSRVRDANIDVDRIVFTGFVTDRVKLRLLLNAAFVIYPSFFEGFGLPVLEATTLGKICVASKTSSIVEVAPSQSIFFDPLDPDSLLVAVRSAIAQSSSTGQKIMSFADLRDRVRAHDWRRAYQHVREWVLSDAITREAQPQSHRVPITQIARGEALK